MTTALIERTSLAMELFAGVKADRPPTSPLAVLYRDWERGLEMALAQEWREKSRLLLERLRVDAAVKAVDDVIGDRDWWMQWALDYTGMLSGPMFEAGQTGSDAAAAGLMIDFALGVDVDQVNLAVSDWARKHAGALAKGLTQTDRGMLQRQLAAWIEAGEDFPALVDRVGGFVENFKRARRIAVTEATQAYAEGNLITWRESDVVSGQIWNTAFDEAVCPICGPLHAQITSLDGDTWRHQRQKRDDLSVGLGVGKPPAHPN